MKAGDRTMTYEDASLAEQWRRSTTAQGVGLGLVLGPVGMLLAYVFSAPNKRRTRFFGALWGSLIAGTVMLVIIALAVVAAVLL
jgi:hypothetical protein